MIHFSILSQHSKQQDVHFDSCSVKHIIKEFQNSTTTSWSRIEPWNIRIWSNKPLILVDTEISIGKQDYCGLYSHFPSVQKSISRTKFSGRGEHNLHRFVLCESTFFLVYLLRRYQLLVPNLHISLLGSDRKTHDILFYKITYNPLNNESFFVESHCKVPYTIGLEKDPFELRDSFLFQQLRSLTVFHPCHIVKSPTITLTKEFVFPNLRR
jgi:hypothetical protein